MSAPDVLPTFPTIRVTDHFGDAEALLGALDLDTRGEQYEQAWTEARGVISHDGVRADSFASGTRLLATTGDLVRHLQGSASGAPVEKRAEVTTKLRAGSDLLVSTALADLRLALSDPIGAPADRVERTTQLLSQATKAHQQAQSVRGNDQSAMAHLSTGWRKLMEGFAGLGIETVRRPGRRWVGEPSGVHHRQQRVLRRHRPRPVDRRVRVHRAVHRHLDGDRRLR